jgi:dephospho-CoA kinase
MSLIYITGPTGAGKTTIKDELIKKGYIAYDTDEDDIAQHQDKYTGQQIEYPADESERTPEWRERHAFNLSKTIIKELAAKAQSQNIFVCGAASNDLELAEYFAKIICLEADDTTVKSRIETRTTNSYGRAPDEMQEILDRHDEIVRKYRSFGAVMLDATMPKQDILDAIISIANQP